MRRLATTVGACAVGACILVAARPERSGAQGTRPDPGAPVRMSVEGVEHPYAGHLVSLTADSVIVQVARSRVVRASRGQVTRLEVGRTGSRTASTLEGIGIGAAIGATVGVLMGPSMVHSNGEQRGLTFIAHDGRVIGGVLLGAIGGAIGGVIGHGRATHWERVPLGVATRRGGVGIALAF